MTLPVAAHPALAGPEPSLAVQTRRSAWVLVLTAASAGLIAVWARLGPDWPAQQFRASFARHFGLLLWNDQWYGGHALPGYSVLYPVVAGVTGAAASAVAAAIVAALAGFVLLPVPRAGPRRVAVGVAIAASVSAAVFIGQVPFLLGVAAGLWALVALTRRRWWLAGALAAVASLASPLAGLFVMMAIPSAAVGHGWRRSAVLLGGCLGSIVAVIVGGGSGPDPFPAVTLAVVLLFCAVLAAYGYRDAVLRRFAIVYAVVALAAFVVPNPVGGNAARLGKLIALPLACALLMSQPAQRRKAALAAVAAAAWIIVPLTGWVLPARTDPSGRATYFQPLLTFLRSRGPINGRVEIPFTRAHWEAVEVALSYPLARGWERQTDLQYNQLLYAPLASGRYHQWLQNNAVAYVALPDAPLDTGGQPEAALLRHDQPYLRPVWHAGHWRVWQVRDARPLVSAPAALVTQDPATFRLRFAQSGNSVVRVRASPLWHVTSGPACVRPTTDGWLLVHAWAPGTVDLAATINGQLLTREFDCPLDP